MSEVSLPELIAIERELAELELQQSALNIKAEALKLRQRQADGWVSLGIVRYVDGSSVGLDYSSALAAVGEAVSNGVLHISDGQQTWNCYCVWVEDRGNDSQLSKRMNQNRMRLFLTGDGPFPAFGRELWLKVKKLESGAA